MNVSEPFIQRPVATTLLMVAILLSGAVAYNLLPLATLPEVDYPTIQVQTFYPGASPEVMTSSVTAPLEVQLGQQPGLNQMISASSAGSSIITLQFNLDLSLDVAEQEVQAAINAANNLLPADLPTPPVYSKVNPADAPILTLAVTSKSLSLTELEDLSEIRIAQKISQQPGVGQVSVSGGNRPAVRVQLNPAALAAYGLNIDDIRTVLGNNNVNTPKGSFDGPEQASSINANDQLTAADQYRRVIVAYRNGNPIMLSDVATVVRGAENVKLAAWSNETPAIILNVRRQPGANVIQVVDGIKALLPQVRAGLPAAVNLDVISDRTTTIRASVEDVEFELALAIVLVVAVIFVFLRTFAATLIPSLSAPLSLIGCLGVMYLLHFSLDNLSLMALTISTGFVVDDAIVMIENIARYVENGMEPLPAALQGAGQIGFTIISLTISLIAVLIPLLFMREVVGRLFHEFAITLAATIVISAFVSLTMVPMLCARLLTHRPESERSRFDRTADEAFKWIIKQYARALDVVLDHQPLTLLVALTTLALTGTALRSDPQRVLPGSGRRNDPGDLRRPSAGVLRPDDQIAKGAGKGHPQRSGRAESEFLHRGRRNEYDFELRQIPYQSEAFQPAQLECDRNHSSAQAGSCFRLRGDALYAAGPGFDDRRKRDTRSIQVRSRRSPLRGIRNLGSCARSTAEPVFSTCGCSQRHAGARLRNRFDDRPRDRGKIWRHARYCR